MKVCEVYVFNWRLTPYTECSPSYKFIVYRRLINYEQRGKDRGAKSALLKLILNLYLKLRVSQYGGKHKSMMILLDLRYSLTTILMNNLMLLYRIVIMRPCWYHEICGSQFRVRCVLWSMSWLEQTMYPCLLSYVFGNATVCPFESRKLLAVELTTINLVV